MQRKVYAAFNEQSKLPDRMFTIDSRGSVWRQVCEQIPVEDERSALIGVKDSTRTTWID